MRALRRAVVTLVGFAVLVAGLAVAGLPVFVHPQIDPLRPADAVVVLGGTAYERFDMGLDLAGRGYAPELLISRSTGTDDHVMDRYCDGGYSFHVDCFVPDPWTTQGEAREIARRAARFGWRHLIVITNTPHVSRARYIVGTCFSGEITMVASPAESGWRYWAWMYVRQSGGYLRAFLSPGC
ncbi:YdcF family protein [Nocardia sp. CDC159]|uniref:YdcF family protein n=1 Tax=Nocardia pulmonis TaxID=2951408 RepID=A0A9X2EFW6_9NOCA|nr:MULTISPECIES: ElyC/SanA/YdcF family protein [Nocardia]MCM6778128.1 YdcF family protein [Nocardia pulmonis]MCM6791017.1 YdcF family protein [Nocardia sp. CDC159]